MPALLDVDGRPLLWSHPRLTVVQSGSTLSKRPFRTLLGMAAAQSGGHPSTAWSHVGYEWRPEVLGNPSGAYSATELLIGRKAGPDPASTTVSFTNATQIAFVEIAGLIGEVLWSTMNYGGLTSWTTTAPIEGFAEHGCVFVTAGCSRSGSNVSATHDLGEVAIADVNQTISRIYVYRYKPGTRPTVGWTFPSTQANSSMCAIVR